MPAAADLHRYGIQRQTDGRPRFFDGKIYLRDHRVGEQNRFCGRLRHRLQQFPGIFFDYFFDQMADFTVMYRIRKLIGEPGFSGVGMQNGGEYKLLS